MVREGDSVFGKTKATDAANKQLESDLANENPGIWNRFSAGFVDRIKRCIYGTAQEPSSGDCQFSEK